MYMYICIRIPVHSYIYIYTHAMYAWTFWDREAPKLPWGQATILAKLLSAPDEVIVEDPAEVWGGGGGAGPGLANFVGGGS